MFQKNLKNVNAGMKMLMRSNLTKLYLLYMIFFRRALISSSSAFYVFILAIFALVYELSHLMKITEEHDPQIVRWMDLVTFFIK